jgi:aldehyde dehydrogenase (NAD+)
MHLYSCRLTYPPSVLSIQVNIHDLMLSPLRSAQLQFLVNGKVITAISAGSAADVDIAVKAAKKAFKTTWGLNVPGAQRGRLLSKLADLMEDHLEEIAALEALDTGSLDLRRIDCLLTQMLGKLYWQSKAMDTTGAIGVLRYYAGWADKIQGKTIQVRTPFEGPQ